MKLFRRTFAALTPRRVDIFFVFLSAVLFYINSAIISYAHGRTRLTAGYFTIGRAFFGLLLLVSISAIRRKRIEKPSEYLFLMLRAIGNFVALYCFFEATVLGGAAIGNTLNLTYPLFLVLFALCGNRTEKRWGTLISSVVAFSGVLMVLRPDTSGWSLRLAIIGLGSGFMGAVAVASLRETRKSNSPETVLLSLFVIGLVLSLAIFGKEMYLPDLRELTLLGSASLFGAIGQYYMTLGAIHISAVESGVVSLSRILIAVLAAPLLAFETAPDIFTITGALLIFGANVYLTLQKPIAASAAKAI